MYDSPGRYVEIGDGQKIAAGMARHGTLQRRPFLCRGDCVTCFAGALLTLEDKSDSGLDDEYLALRCAQVHGADLSQRRCRRSGPAYEGNFEFIKSDKRYVPPRVTPKAVVEGPQTAKVVGEGDIDVDEYGRILVRFHWDQEEDQSRRCRVAQVWAGNHWGGIYTPRVGMEVVVIFLEGDPDQPLVIGCVYNDKHMPPYDLPDDKTISGMKSNTTPDGNGFNEFVFDDEDGIELVRLHAQRDLDSIIENDEFARRQEEPQDEDRGKRYSGCRAGLKIDAGTKIEITVGGSKITMTPGEDHDRIAA